MNDTNTVDLRTVFDCFLDPKFVKEHGVPMTVAYDGSLVLQKHRPLMDFIKGFGFKPGNRNGSRKSVKKTRQMFTVKKLVETKSLGRIVLTSVFIDGSRGDAVPTLFLTNEQKVMIEEKGIRVLIKPREHVDNGEMYICYPGKAEFEEIVLL